MELGQDSGPTIEKTENSAAGLSHAACESLFRSTSIQGIKFISIPQGKTRIQQVDRFTIVKL